VVYLPSSTAPRPAGRRHHPRQPWQAAQEGTPSRAVPAFSRRRPGGPCRLGPAAGLDQRTALAWLGELTASGQSPSETSSSGVPWRTVTARFRGHAISALCATAGTMPIRTPAIETWAVCVCTRLCRSVAPSLRRRGASPVQASPCCGFRSG